MKKRLFLLLLMAVVIVGFNGCATMNKNSNDSALDTKLKKLKVPAVIAVTPELGFTALKFNGNDAKRCSIPEKGKKPEYEICPAFREGAEIIDKQTITIIKSKGSVCYTYYDIHRIAHKICIPPE